MYRGSRKHVLDWTDRPRFVVELLELLKPVDCRLSAESEWQPVGYRFPTEARLEQFGPKVLPGHPAWAALTPWWLKYARGANTPNWDLALRCDIEGRPGLVLVEAKANVPELSSAGKRPDRDPSPRSDENHEHIGLAIAEACRELAPMLPGISIHRDRHYQLSNRIAFGWRLASLGVPTVLVYLGFTGDLGIQDAGEPFADAAHWEQVFQTHLSEVCPASAIGSCLDMGAAKLWLLVRSRAVLEASPPLP